MLNKKSQSHLRKKLRIRKKVFGTAERPRMVIHKSNKHIYVQFVDDLKGKTLLSVSSSTLKLKNAANIKASVSLAEAASKKAISAGIKQVVFDRGGYIYHGKVRAFAESCRKAGLKF
ncbi:MAG: 50S ribosomal protein L18 [Elusimicrobia bacterium]|nr:50S ribosomal protein L18 [Elusimicrobiota bacterium]